jgi:hypothetical protein
LLTPAIIADKAERTNARRKSARVLTFEDGISRHITLTGRQWANYDAALDAGYKPEQLHWLAFDTAKEIFESGGVPDFEEELRQCFLQMTTHIWTKTSQGRRQVASNWGPPEN